MLFYNCSSHLLARGLASSSRAIPAFCSSRANDSTFPSRPYCFPLSSRAVRLTFPSCSFRFPLSRALSAQNFRPAGAIFLASLRAVRPIFPFVRPVSVASCVTRPTSLPVRPVSRSVPCRALCAHCSFLLSPGTTVLDEQLCYVVVC